MTPEPAGDRVRICDYQKYEYRGRQTFVSLAVIMWSRDKYIDVSTICLPPLSLFE